MLVEQKNITKKQNAQWVTREKNKLLHIETSDLFGTRASIEIM